MYQIAPHHNAMHEVLTKELGQTYSEATELMVDIYRLAAAGLEEEFFLLNGMDFKFRLPTKTGQGEGAYSFFFQTLIRGKRKNFYFPIPGLKSSIIGTRFKGKHPEKWLYPDSRLIRKMILKAVRSFTPVQYERVALVNLSETMCKELIRDNSIKSLLNHDMYNKSFVVDQGPRCSTEVEIILSSHEQKFYLYACVTKIRRNHQEIIFMDKIELKSIADVSRSE